MARKVRAASLENRTARLRLPVRKKSYFVTVARGIALGYRRNRGAGTWSVRAGSGPDAWLKAFAIADDFEEADGEHVLTFWQAQDQARSLARATAGTGYKLVTVAEALDHYAADLRARGGDPVNAQRVRNHLTPPLAAKAVALLTSRELRAWRDQLATKVGPATVNRITKVAKAALNLARRDDLRISDDAWRSSLAALPDSQRPRNIVPSDTVINAIVAGAYTADPALGLFVETAATTGARPSQLVRLTVGDLQLANGGPRLMMPDSRKGRRRVLGRKPVPLTAALAMRLHQATAGRPDDAPLLDSPRYPGFAFRRITAALGVDPAVTLYALRHASITRALLRGLPVRLVASLHDTSILEIERTYSACIADHSDALARGALLQPEPLSPTANVVPLPLKS